MVEGSKSKNLYSKKLLKVLRKRKFLSNIITLNVNGKSQNVLLEVKYHILSDEPTHVDFKVLPGVKIKMKYQLIL